jgi:ankyrin repeat protein
LVGFFIFHGSKIDAQNSDGETALMRAISNNHAETAITLINCNANVEITKPGRGDFPGVSAIGLAFHQNMIGVINHILSVSKTSKSYEELLCLAAKAGNVDLIKCIDILITVPVNAVVNTMSALHWSCASGKIDFVEVINF